jgi:hypothetical protein
MRLAIPTLALAALCLASAQARAASCASFAVLKSYDAAASTVEVDYNKGNMKKYFPRPEGSPSDSTKIPKPCRGKVTKTKQLVVKPTGGRMTVTQIRSNFEGKMLNDTSDPNWLPAELKKLIDAKTEIVIIVRPGMGKDAPLGITTLYLPITDEELAEIQRIEKQAEDVG